ncbi:single-stranded DNA-binding protein [Staphylococcus hyicus]|uniref:single-stranded DNA-binding protein n=1 Tax=Staphylococcus hyicus TaxID=1284 RepID=UPI003132BCBE
MTTINQFQAIGIIIKSHNYYDTNDTPFITLTIKIERDYKSKKDKPIFDYLNCKAYGTIAQAIHETCHKEDLIAVIGQIQSRRYDYEGERRYTTELVIAQIKHLSSTQCLK